MRVASRISIAYLFLFVPIINQLAIANSDNYCDFLPETAQPAWVAGENRLPGYYVGVGESDTRRGSAEAQKMAKQRALADLSSSISTHVTQRLSIQINTGSGENSFQKNFEERTKTITQNSIKNSTRDAIWLDRQSCRLWTRVKVSEKEVVQAMGTWSFREPYKAFKRLKLMSGESGGFFESRKKTNRYFFAIIEQLLDAVSKVSDPDMALANLETMTVHIGAHSVFYQLLGESSETMALFVQLATSSSFIEMLDGNVGLFDEFIDKLSCSTKATREVQEIDFEEVFKSIVHRTNG